MNIYYSSKDNNNLLLYKYNNCIDTYKNYSLYTFKRNKDSVGSINVDNINPNGIIIRDFENCYLQYWEIVKLFTIPKNVIIFINESKNGKLLKIKKIHKIIDLLDLTVNYINLDDVFIDKKDVDSIKKELYNNFDLSDFIITYSENLCNFTEVYYASEKEFLNEVLNINNRADNTIFIRRLLCYILHKAGLPTKIINKKFNYKDSQTARTAIIRLNNEYHKLNIEQIDILNYLIKQAISTIEVGQKH